VKIFLIRHGETEASVLKWLCGRTDVPLTDGGIRQIQGIAAFLSGRKPAVIYTSPLLRARQSAEILRSRFGVTIVEDRDLREVDFGDWEGLTMDQIRLRAPAELDHLRRSPDTFVFPNGESVADLVLRVRGFMGRVIEAQERDGTCCVVSHGGPLRAALLDALEIPLRNYWRLAIAHGSVSCLSHDGGGVVLSLLGCMP